MCEQGQTALFLLGKMGVFQGDLKSLSGSENCVVLTLLHGCENWILIEGMLLTLENFQEKLEGGCSNSLQH